MRRGDIVTVALPGDFGKPRPAIVVQSDWLSESDSVLVCLLTTTLRAAPLYRVDVEPASATGLRAPSQAMIDKLFAVRRAKCGNVIGRIDDTTTRALDRALSLAIGLIDR
ncbi:MAG: type II toxin-antitoxin system PemK/MazF family toxin [Tagaea sp.]|nr:type II toxin-antitoxin system PemK/MazF family toxin [Tagaea sp.]